MTVHQLLNTNDEPKTKKGAVTNILMGLYYTMRSGNSCLPQQEMKCNISMTWC